MKHSLKRVMLHILFILLLLSCFQAVIFLFPVGDSNVLDIKRLMIVFIMCSIALVHNIFFNHYVLKMKKWVVYLPVAILLVIAGMGFIYFLLPKGTQNAGNFEHFPEIFGIVFFFLMAGLALNSIYLLLIVKSNYLENQIIMKQLELDHLKNQLNPHFLFNSLNNVAATIQVDSELALNYIYTLSSLLRYQIESSDKETVTLGEENFFIESFLGIEEFRLGERCEMSFDSDLSNPGEKFPPMLLQPFVEHAIRQSCRLDSRAVVKIALSEKNRKLYLVTKSSSPETIEPDQDSSNEIENAKKRLRMFYQNSHKITTQLVNGFVVTTLFIDLKNYKRIS
ncbi:MAG: sensor histidine kinase [Lentimicrobium sp.]